MLDVIRAIITHKIIINPSVADGTWLDPKSELTIAGQELLEAILAARSTDSWEISSDALARSLEIRATLLESEIPDALHELVEEGCIKIARTGVRRVGASLDEVK